MRESEEGKGCESLAAQRRKTVLKVLVKCDSFKDPLRVGGAGGAFLFFPPFQRG